DYLANRIGLEETRRWPPPFGDLRNGLNLTRSLLTQDCRNTFKYIASTLKLHSRTDVFFLCMRESITSFYRSLGQPHLAARNDRAFRLVDLCSDLGARAAAAAIKKAPASPVLSSIKHCDVLVIGGTGFIGRHLVAALSTQGKRVAVMARNVRRLPPV